MNILNMLGLMTTAKHNELRSLAVARLESSLVSKDETIERVCGERDRLKDKLGEEIRGHTRTALECAEANKKFKQAVTDLASQADEIAALKPRATKWDDYLKRSRERKANKPAPNAPPRAPVSAKANGKRAA